MDMRIEDIVFLAANFGFPVAMCFILLRYILQSIGEKFDKLDNSLNRLTKLLREMEAKNRQHEVHISKSEHSHSK